MKKIFLMILCVFFVSVCANCAFASGDVNNIETDDSIPISDNNDIFVSVDIGEDLDFNCTEIVDASNSNAPSDNADNIEADDSIPISDNNDIFVSVDIGEDLDFNCTEIVDESNSISPSDNSLYPMCNIDFNNVGVVEVKMPDFKSDADQTSTQKASSIVASLKLDSNDPYYPYVFSMLVKYFDNHKTSSDYDVIKSSEGMLSQILSFLHKTKTT